MVIMQTIRKYISILAVAIAGSVLMNGVLAANQLINISSTKNAGVDVIKFEFSENLSQEPVIFSVQKPARLSFDFADAESAKGRFFVDLSQGAFNSAQVIPSGDRVRVVLDLKQLVSYQTRINNNLFILSAKAQAAAPTSNKAVLFESKQHNKQVLPLKNIDFRLGGANAGKVILSLPNDKIDAKVQRKGNSLEVSLAQVSLPQGIARKLDVADFATPVKFITSGQLGNATVVRIDASGNWDYNAYQSAGQFNVEIYKIRDDVAKNAARKYSGEKLSLNFQDIPIRQLLQVIADFTKFNIVTSDDVQGNLTLRLKDVPWDQALDIILESKGLGKRQKGNIIWVAKKEEINAKELDDLKALSNKRELEELITQSFQINYAKAEVLAKQLGGSSAEGSMKLLTERGSAVAEKRTNQLFITDVPSKLKEIEDLLTKIDVPVRQVLIEARIVEANDTFGRSLGMKLGIGDSRSYRVGGSNLMLGNPTTVGGAGSGGQQSIIGPVNQSLVNLPAAALEGAVSSAIPSLGFTIFGSNVSRFINLEISAMEAEGEGKVISSPRIVAADQDTALIEQGTEIPYQEASASGATSVSFKKANLKLEVTPQITPEGSVFLDIDVTKDAPNRTIDVGGNIAIDTKHVKTKVLVENGGTVVIGGIYTITEGNSVSKVPLLGDVPVLGNLFKTRKTERAKKEMLVFISPKIVMSSGLN